MRKFLMITTAVYGLSLFAPAISQAQTCKPAPDCADMGYDKSEDQCVGKKMLKCPFDLTAVSCEDGGSGDVIDMSNLVWEESERICIGENDSFVAKSYNGTSGYEFTFPEDGCVSYYGGVGGRAYINSVGVQIPGSLKETLLCFKKGTTFWKIGFEGGYTGTGCDNGGLDFVPAKASTIKITYEVEAGSLLSFAGATVNSGSIDWGDGTVDDFATTKKHTYANAGIYTVTIRGNVPKLKTNVTSSSKNYVLSFDQLNLRSLTEATGSLANGTSFVGDCSKATGTIPELPPNLISAQRMFYRCKGLSGNIPELPVSLTDGASMFESCKGLNGNIPELPDSLTNGSSMFEDCENLTGGISTLPSSLTDGSYMFYGCEKLTGTPPVKPSSLTSYESMFYHSGINNDGTWDNSAWE